VLSVINASLHDVEVGVGKGANIDIVDIRSGTEVPSGGYELRVVLPSELAALFRE
jgi:hypothetical protein